MRALIRLVLVCLGLLACSQAGWSSDAAEPFPRTSVTFDRPVHFIQEDGRDVAVDPATYLVEHHNSTLRLVPDQGGDARIIPVESLSVDMPVQEPAVLSLMRNSDEHLLLYAEPDGEVVGAAGSYSGIRTREIIGLKQSLVSQIVSSPMHLPGGNILPGVPRLKSVSFTSFANQGALVPFANVNLTIVMSNFLGPAGTRIQYRIVPPGSITGQSACTLTRNPRIGVSDSFQLDQNGEGRISLPGWFTSSVICAIGIELFLPGKPEAARLVAGPIEVRVPLRYTLSGTSNLKAMLGVRVSSSLGTCEGTSIGPTNYSVGVVENGADLAFRIRSGPLGTECQFTSKAWLLPDGVRLVSAKWEAIPEIPPGQEQGKCCVVNAFGNNCITMPPHAGFNFTRGTAPVVTGEHPESPPYYSMTSVDRQILEDGVIILDNQPPRVVTVVKPMWGKLQCTNTLVNDHGVKLVLRELVLEGPPGLTFP